MPEFNNSPVVKIDNSRHETIAGWKNIALKLKADAIKQDREKTVIVVECYQGVLYDEIRTGLVDNLEPDLVLESSEGLLSQEDILDMTFPDVTDDRVFGYITRLELSDFFDNDKTGRLRQEAEQAGKGIILVLGTGASLICPDPDIMVYADMARWEIQTRMRRNEVHNLGIRNEDEAFEIQYKRGFFVDWRVCDRHKKKLMPHWNYVMDTNRRNDPVMITSDLFSKSLAHVVTRPFSVVPYYDPGPWGGQWMKERLDLDKDAENYAWCFNCVPEENSLYLDFEGTLFETPSINLVFFETVNLLGDPVHARFGDEFPIRFDFLDTIDGGNLSLQVHPLTEYIREKFGMQYTQDESYYMLDAKPGAHVYLGFRENIDPDKMITELRDAEKNGSHFEAEKYVQKWPAARHDHFLIPGGTIHCSGKDSMVLEISSTPYIFTFKLWDWGRVGLDGQPRPINLNHGINNLQWDRDKSWTEKNLVNRVEILAEGDDWREEKTGLHEREFIETRRHWFTGQVHHNTDGVVNVLNLIEGEEIVVKSPHGHFDPFVVHYAETFIVPASVGEYTIRPYGKSVGKECATIKAYVRTKG